MNLYAESSAVLSWLLGETAGEEVRDLLAGADGVVSSDLTLVECDRVLIRAVDMSELTEGEAAERRRVLGEATARWSLLFVGSEVLERSRRPFPAEPVRTLDAVHLASALVARASVSDLRLLSLDDVIRRNGDLVGLSVVP